jgi:hypothetical protein
MTMDFNPMKAVGKAVLYGVVGAAMAFFAGTFFGIMGLLMFSAVSPTPPNYANAYLLVGLPLAGVVFVVVLAGSLVRDLRAAARQA